MKIKMKQKNRDYLLFVIMAVFIVSLIIISGCTGLNFIQHESVSAVMTPTATTEISPSPSETAGEKLFEPVKLPGPGLGKEEYFSKHKYDPET
ncbi:MAG: hypothetical protein PHV39_08965, partial [Methanomicrobium sp.]|nr:hypothetical protein [Methanomicrobium sp.]